MIINANISKTGLVLFLLSSILFRKTGIKKIISKTNCVKYPVDLPIAKLATSNLFTKKYETAIDKTDENKAMNIGINENLKA